MKVIFVNRFFYPDHSATSQMLSDLAFALALEGEAVHIVTSRLRYDEPAAKLTPFEVLNGVQVHRVFTTRFGRNWLPGRLLDYLSFYAAATWRLLRLAQRGDIIIAKTDPPLISVPAGWVAGIKGGQLVNWLQDLFPEVANALGVSLARGTPYRFMLWLRDRSLKKASSNIAIGERMKELLIKRGVSPGTITVMPNWADLSEINAIPAEENPLRREWGLGSKFVVGYSGNLGRAHEYQTILQAAETLRDNSQVVFLFIGSGARLPALQQEVRSRGLSNVVFKPYQPREMLSYSLSAPDAHLVVLRPELEGLIVPSKTYGALAADRPVLFVGDPDGEIPRMLDRESAGVAVRAGDGAALAARVLELSTANSRERSHLHCRQAISHGHRLSDAVITFKRALELPRTP